MVIPYLASFGWYAGTTSAEPRKSNRCVIKTNGDRLELAVPVAGGGRRLRGLRGWELAEVSDHGNWTRRHCGALEAAYGRTPFFSHLFPGLKEVLDNPPALLADLCRELDAAVRRFLYGGGTLPGQATPQALARGREVLALVDPGVSLADPLMRFGPETLLALLAAREGKHE